MFVISKIIMRLNARPNRKKIVLCFSFLVCSMFTFTSFFYKESQILAKNVQRVQVSLNLKIIPEPAKSASQGKVLLPIGFNFSTEELKSYLKETSAEKWTISQLESWQVVDLPLRDVTPLENMSVNLFNTSENESCEEREKKLEFKTDQSHKLNFDLLKIMEVFKEEMEGFGDTYNQHVWPVFQNFTTPEKLDKNWFRTSGTSVWLKDYNVHFVLSQLIFSETGLRNQPRLSMLLVQIYDISWHELDDVRLVFPSNDEDEAPGFETNGQKFMSYRFPRLLPIPFDIGQRHKYWGAEDPRLILRTHKNGYDEPILIFNSFHVSEDTDREIYETPGTRSIFMSYPFRVQKGKSGNVPVFEKTFNHWFTLTKNMEMKNKRDVVSEKMWMPIISTSEDYQEHTLFATQLDPVRIVKCELWPKTWPKNWSQKVHCEIEVDSELRESFLGGGTPLVNIKTIDYEDREYFVGFAKGVSNECGCGTHFERPNLIVVARKGTKWRTTHVSSFMDLGLDVTPYGPQRNVCDSVNTIRPIDIGYINFHEDVLTFFVSVSGASVEKVHLKNFLSSLANSGVLEANFKESSSSPLGCASNAGEQYCKAYGDMVKSQGQVQDVAL